jgi:ribosomal protein L3 glutamine methyltransferase
MDSTVVQLMTHGARRFERARLVFGHGTDNALDEAAALIFHALKLDHAAAPGVYTRPVTVRERREIERLFERRVRERIPAAYLTRRTWFAGLEFYVDERVLIPRSPLAELIEQRFSPWVDPKRVRRVLDIGTGSGCIAIACARAFPRAHVDAIDISAPALAVARRNIRRHRLGRRVQALKSKHFSALGNRHYDIIVSNPPYVGARELKALPAEYRHEPPIALAGGPDGLEAVQVILCEAAKHLKRGGVLVVEVGDTQSRVAKRYPTLPFTWLEFERGGGGVFLLKAEDL